MQDDKRWLLSSWIVHNAPANVNSNNVQFVEEQVARPALGQRALASLRYLANLFPQGKYFSVGGILSQPEHLIFLAHSWSKNGSEASFLLMYLLESELGYIARTHPSSSDFLVTPRGWLALEDSANTTTTIGFVAMWFSAEVEPLYEHSIYPAIREAGYEPLRIDKKEHTNRIDDEIVASIRAARFLVADYTGNRGGVYYEAGFAHGLGLPVFFMAREKESLHFDIRQYNTIFWTNDELEKARDRLKNRILATLGRGPFKTS